MSDFEQIVHIGRDRHGAVTLRQLRGIGLSDRQVGGLVRSGFLVRRANGVFTVVGAPETWEQRVCIEVLIGGPQAMGSHRCAAGLWRLDDFRRGAIDIVSPRWTRHGGDHANVHETSDLPGRDRGNVEGIAVTSPTRTLIDMGRFVGAHRLGAMLDDAVRRGLTSYEATHERFRELARSGRNGIRTMRRVLEERPGGAPAPGSDFETKVRRLLVGAGFQAPALQHPVVCGEYRFLLDLAWPDRMLAVECEGFRFHRTPDQLAWDEFRRNQLTLRNWTVLAYTWIRVRDDPDGVIAEVRQALS